MTRRLNHTDNPDWNIWLYIAAFGAFVIAIGIFFQLLQLFVSFKNKEKLNDTTGDPWNGHTLEWSTASPPQFYNFAKIPHIKDIDAWTDMKERGESYQRPEKYTPIHMPKNTSAGVFMSMSFTLMGFALIWHIWWLAVVGLVAGIGVFIKRCYTSDVDYYVQVDEVERVEATHLSANTVGGRS